jgi:hypothetical protein
LELLYIIEEVAGQQQHSGECDRILEKIKSRSGMALYTQAGRQAGEPRQLLPLTTPEIKKRRALVSLNGNSSRAPQHTSAHRAREKTHII